MLWIPGPTHVRPEILAECARPMIGHRSAAMNELHERIDPGLRLAFGLAPASTAQVAVHTASATALMEAALHGVGPRVLVVVNGAFSKRFLEIARLLGKEARALEVAWGSAVEPAELERVLEREGPFDALALVSNETSTGVRTPLAPLAEVLARHPRVLFLVDLVSYLAGAPVDFDENRIDFGFAGSQKALALPPGITVFCASHRYLEAARARRRPSWYLDPVRLLDGHAERKTPATPCIPLYHALARQLEDISAGRGLPAGESARSGADAWRARFAKHERMRARTLAWARSHDLAPFPAEPLSSPTVSCIRSESIDTAAFLAGLEKRGEKLSSGYGDLKGKTFRIGHMGDHSLERLRRCLATLV